MTTRRYLLAILCLILTGCPQSPVHAQTPVQLTPSANIQYFDGSGNPLAGGKLYTYAAGTTTPQATYAENTGTTALPNPIILNSSGFVVNGSGAMTGMWLTSSCYKIIAQNSASVQQWSMDNVCVGVFAAGNTTFSGNNTFSGTNTFNGPLVTTMGGTLGGSFGGSPNFTGAPTFNTATFSGALTASGGIKTDSILGTVGNGAAFTFLGKDGTTGAGEQMNVRAGNGFTNFAGGEFDLFAGNGGTGTGPGGRLWLQSGTGGTGNTLGGDARFYGGGGAGTGAGGLVDIRSGGGGATGNGGGIIIQSGLSGITSGNGGGLSLVAGANNVASAGGNGGQVLVQAGNGGILTPGTGGSITLQPGDGMTAKGVVNVNGGIGPYGTGLKHARVSTGAIGATTWAEVIITWSGTAFANTNYTATCSVKDSTTAANAQGLVLERIRTQSTTQIGAVIQNPTGGAITGVLDCIAMHDGN